jgi:benzoyl-CoA reductase/2-hydroxyglutaryl-CoA dehydratase subunit BcrC/BadD/HgdB
MIDYADSLINISQAIKEYRQCILKNNIDGALHYSELICDYAHDLDCWTENQVANGQ